MKITRQSDYYGLDYRYSVPTSLAQPATKPPVGLEDMLKSKSVTPGTMLHQVNQALNATPSQDTGPDRWPAVLPGDQLVNAIGGTEHQVKNLLPKVKPPKAVPKSQVAPVAKAAAEDLPNRKTAGGFIQVPPKNRGEDWVEDMPEPDPPGKHNPIKNYADQLRSNPGEWKKWPDPTGFPIPFLNKNIKVPHAYHVNSGIYKDLPPDQYEARSHNNSLYVRYKGSQSSLNVLSNKEHRA